MADTSSELKSLLKTALSSAAAADKARLRSPLSRPQMCDRCLPGNLPCIGGNGSCNALGLDNWVRISWLESVEHEARLPQSRLPRSADTQAAVAPNNYSFSSPVRPSFSGPQCR